MAATPVPGHTPAPAAQAALNRKLEALAQEFGAAAIYVIDRQGMAFGASNWRQPHSFIGRDYTFRPYFQQALQTGQAQQFALGTASHRPGLYLATRAAGGAAVVVVKLEFDGIESAWHRAGGITYVTDRAGVILVASRPAWRFAATTPLDPGLARVERLSLGVAALPTAPFALARDGMVVPAGTDTPHLAVATAPDAAGWRVNLALPLAGAARLPDTHARHDPGSDPASSERVQAMLDHFEQALLAVGFLDPRHPKKLVPRMRQMWTRNRLSADEVDMVRGLCTAMIRSAGRPAPDDAQSPRTLLDEHAQASGPDHHV